VSAALQRFLWRYWGILAVLAAWQLWVAAAGLNAIVMPTPAAVALAVARDPVPFLQAGLRTLELAVAGLVVGMAFGTLLAVLSWSSRVLDGLLTPVGVLSASVPVVALIPVIARLLGYGIGTEIVIVTIICFLPAFVFTGAGMRALPPGAADLFAALGARRFMLLWRLALPAALPAWMVALRLAAPQAVLAAMVAEFLMGTDGLGKMFRDARDHFDMDAALGLSAIAAIAAIAAFLLAQTAEARARERFS
jgi:ABC-type nitrate/sulfonate/bicarbonate transport system permease component